MKLCAAYVIKNETKDLFYIGSSANIKHRLGAHRWGIKNNKHHNVRFRESYEEGDHITVTLYIASNVEETREMELELITLNKNNPKCVNIAHHIGGGDNLTNHPERKNIIEKMTTSVRKRYSEMSHTELMRLHSKPGDKNPMFGKTHTEEARKRISEKLMGKSPPNKGKSMSDVQKKLLSEVAAKRTGEKNGFFGRRHSDETKQKIREKNQGNVPLNARPIVIDGVTFTSAQEASRKLGINYTTIRHRVKSPNPKYMGYYFVDKCPTTSESTAKEMDNGDE